MRHKHRRSAALAVLLALALGGCSLIPTLERPAPPVPADWPDAAKGSTAQAAPTLDWNTFFPDERLRALIRLALDNNRDLRIATARIGEARALYGIQRADRLPGISAGVSQTAARTPADLAASGTDTTSRRFDANLGMLPFELDFWGRVASLSQAAQASYLATEQAQRAFRLSLVSSVADAYLALAEAQERLALARATLDSRAQTRQLVERRREVGLAGDLDFLQADAAWQGAKAEVAGLQRQQAAAGNFLRSLLGAEPGALPAGRALADQAIPLDLQADVPAQALLRRPDILAAEQRLVAANANIGAARGLLPAHHAHGLGRHRQPRTLGSVRQRQQRLELCAQPEPAPVRRPAQPVQSRSDRSAQGPRRGGVRACHPAGLPRGGGPAERARRAGEQLQAQQAQERSQQQALKLADARYRQGVGSFLEVLDAQRQLYAVQQNVIQTRRALLSAAAQLYKALGGADA